MANRFNIVLEVDEDGAFSKEECLALAAFLERRAASEPPSGDLRAAGLKEIAFHLNTARDY